MIVDGCGDGAQYLEKDLAGGVMVAVEGKQHDAIHGGGRQYGDGRYTSLHAACSTKLFFVDLTRNLWLLSNLFSACVYVLIF